MKRLRLRGPHREPRYTKHTRTGLFLSLLDDEATESTQSICGDEHMRRLDGTGLVCVWPAAEALCDFLLGCSASWRPPPRVIELGCGAGLPGMLAATLGSSSVTVSSQPELAIHSCALTTIALEFFRSDGQLTDYHPMVLSALRAAVSRNQLDARCRVDSLDWDAEVAHGESPVWPMAVGADLAVSARGAASLARAARAVCLRRTGGIFLYAHTVRRAIYRDREGTVRREATDSALDALLRHLSDLECRPLRGGGTDRAQAEEDGEPVRLFAFGTVGRVEEALPAGACGEALVGGVLPGYMH